jgi:uncharacterized protein YkwD
MMSTCTRILPRPLRRAGLLAGTTAVALTASLLTGAGPAAAAVSPHARTRAETSMVAAVFAELNAERRAHHLPALTSNATLKKTARAHNARMQQKNSLSHQLSGEKALGTRITAAGYTWHTVGENIAWTSSLTTKAVLALEKAMYNEKAPNDGHRLNILAKGFADLGVDVYGDAAHHRIWLTTDFGHR